MLQKRSLLGGASGSATQPPPSSTQPLVALHWLRSHSKLVQSGRAHHNEMADDARSGSDRTLQIGDVVSLYNVDTQGYLAGDGIVDPRVMLARNETDGHPPSNFRECLFVVCPMLHYNSQKAHKKTKKQQRKPVKLSAPTSQHLKRASSDFVSRLQHRSKRKSGSSTTMDQNHCKSDHASNNISCLSLILQ